MGINLKSVGEVHVKQPNKTQGFRTRKGFYHQFDAAVDAETPSRSYFDVSFPYDIDLSQGDYYFPSVDPATRLWVESPPNLSLDLVAQSVGYPVGSAVLGGAVASGDTEVVLNPVAAAILSSVLTDSTTKKRREQEVYFRLTSVPGDETDYTALRAARWDAKNGKLVSPTGAAFNLTANAGEHVFITLRFEDGAYLAGACQVRMGDDSLDSSHVPAGTVIRLVIENPSINPLDAFFNLTYYKD